MMVNELVKKYGPYALYIASNQGKKITGERLKSLSLEMGHVGFIGVRTVNGNTEAEKEAARKEYRIRYAEKLAELKGLKEDWAKEHPDYYRMQPCLPQSVDLSGAIAAALDGRLGGLQVPDGGNEVGLLELVQIYKGLGEVLKAVDGEPLNPFCTELKPMLNIEHRAEWDEALAGMHAKLALPAEREFLAESLVPHGIKSVRIALNRQPCEFWDGANAVIEACVAAIKG